ncbi:MAG: glycosyl hydrolase [Candidatus Sumerlaeota bacterium]|nr:glycosyl hydrolase [Candidatus Sumerlaeota bacterium]
MNEFNSTALLDSQSLEKEFRNPSNGYRMIPLFRVNDEVDRGEIRWQIKSLKEQGCGGIFSICECFHDQAPRKFTSDWWWQAVDWMAEACDDEGIQFWVYDDEDWPSGSVGGLLPEKYPETMWKYLKPVESRFTSAGPVSVDVGPGIFVAAVAHREHEGVIDASSLADISDRMRDGAVTWETPDNGVWVVTVYTAIAGKGIFIDGYGDLMDRDAMAKFIDWVYDGHYRRLKEKGRSITGFFTDEPAFSYAMIEWGGRFDWYPSMPYTPAVLDAFKAQHGCDARRFLPLLYHDDGREALRFRCLYLETCCRLYSENYFKQIYDYCEERGLLSSGHLVVEEDFMNHLAQQGGNIVRHYRHMHIPGIDWIHPFDGFQHLPSTTPKYATSMAHLMGRPRTWCESFAAAGWGLPFQQMRRIVNWEHVNGINMQIPITYKYSLRGRGRASFFPPGISYQQPWWDHFRGFADYEARMCALTSGGGHVAQAVLAYPSVDIWSHCWDHALLKERSKEYNALGDAMRAAGYDYDILDDEALLDHAVVRSGRLAASAETFEVLILPRQDAARRATVARCLDLARAGGAVIFTGSLPAHSYEAGSNDPQLAAQLADLFGDALGAVRAGEKAWNTGIGPGGGRAGFAPTPLEAAVMMREVVKPDLEAAAGANIYAWHRRLNDAELYILFNNSDQRQLAQVSLGAKGYPEDWDPVTGRIEALGKFQHDDGRTALALDFAPFEAKAIVLRPKKSAMTVRTDWKVVREVKLPDKWRFEVENTLLREHVSWNFPADHNGWTSKTGGTRAFPAEIALGDWSQQGLPYFSGIGHYETIFDLERQPAAGRRVVLDLGRVGLTAKVRVNGQDAGIVFFEPYRLDITGFVSAGRNSLRVSVANTLANHHAQFVELDDQPFNLGGDTPERRVSGLIGPAHIRVEEPADQAN